MIYYNFPERGAFEYDKFLISILSYYNEAMEAGEELSALQQKELEEITSYVNERLAKTIENSKASQAMQMLSKIK